MNKEKAVNILAEILLSHLEIAIQDKNNKYNLILNDIQEKIGSITSLTKIHMNNTELEDLFSIAKRNYVNNHVIFSVGANEQSFIAKCYIEALITKLKLPIQITFDTQLPYESLEDTNN